MSLISIADGQLATSATSIVNGGQVNGGRVSVTFNNTSGTNTETIAVYVSRNGGTNRQIVQIVLAPHESAVLSNVPLDNQPGNTADSLLASTTDATTVDYYVTQGGQGPVVVSSFDSNGNLKQVNGTSLTAATTITSASATALAVGPNGATNPTLQVDGSTASAATGLKVKSAAAAGGLAVSVVSSGTNENLKIDAKGSGTITLGSVSTGSVVIGPGATTVLAGTLTAGGLLTCALQVATSGPLIYSGSGAPTISAAVKGSLYLRTDGSTTATRAYIATDTVGTWTAITTTA